ncbi:MAG TPA: M81 family metallopeptidase [Xanthobacteraceae bacterium]|nr:M81 family metallopeptidase [Xanthobacteraceae bacterium]
MRIAVGGFMHETNTFVATPTTWDDFVQAGPWPTVTEGEAILTVFRNINLALAHFIQAAEAAGHTILPLAWACAQPAGRVTDAAFERMAGKLIEGLRDANPDAVFLELHGAMVTESRDDGEGELLQRVRAAVGPGVPVLVSLDLHANLSVATVELADFISSYRTYPHVDWGASGARCAAWLDRVSTWKRSARAFRQAPFLIPVTAGCTYVEPSKGLYEQLAAIEAETGVHLSLNMGFPPADIFDVGPSITAYGAEQAQVDAAADRLYAALLAAEPAFAAHRPLPVTDAVAEAKRLARTAARPVVLADTQDNPGAGAPSNTTGLIAELLRQDAERAAVGIVHDVGAAEAAHAAGVGGVVDRLGGGGEGPGQEPLPGPWKVVAISDGRFKGTSPMLRVAETNMGKTALVQRNGVEVLVASIRQQPIHRETFTHLGIDLNARAIIGVKSSAHFRSGYQEIAEKVIVCLAPGVNIEDPASFRFTKIRPGVRLRPQG